MNNKNTYRQNLLKTWEETYKKGQLTFWILLTLRDEPKYINDIQEFIKMTTKGTISCEDQSLYRALRKFRDLEMVDYELRKGHKGPDRKYYTLTPLGKDILEEFIQRNIRILYNKQLAALFLKTGGLDENDVP